MLSRLAMCTSIGFNPEAIPLLKRRSRLFAAAAAAAFAFALLQHSRHEIIVSPWEMSPTVI
jgi:hypothetical protein